MAITRLSQPIASQPAFVLPKAPNATQPDVQIVKKEQIAQQQKARTCANTLKDNSGKIGIGAALASIISAGVVQRYRPLETPIDVASDAPLPPLETDVAAIPCGWTTGPWCALTTAVAPKLMTNSTTLGLAGMNSVSPVDAGPVSQAFKTADKTHVYTVASLVGLPVLGLTIYLLRRCLKSSAKAGASADSNAALTQLPPHAQSRGDQAARKETPVATSDAFASTSVSDSDTSTNASGSDSAASLTGSLCTSSSDSEDGDADDVVVVSTAATASQQPTSSHPLQTPPQSPSADATGAATQAPKQDFKPATAEDGENDAMQVHPSKRQETLDMLTPFESNGPYYKGFCRRLAGLIAGPSSISLPPLSSPPQLPPSAAAASRTRLSIT